MIYGCLKEIDDKRDYKMKIAGASAPVYPASYTIKMPRVKNQGAINSCVAHSLSTFMEEYYKNENQYFSVGFIYGYRPEGYHQGEGMYPREALKTLQKIGNVKQNEFPYNKEIPEIKTLVDKNIERLTSLADDYKIESYARIYTESEIKKCLYNDCPVPISIPVYNNLRVTNGIITEPIGNISGYHMVILYGWNEQGWLLQNSWGTNWGNLGRAILPYNYPIDSAWAISTKTNNIETYQTFLQKLQKLIIKIINYLKKIGERFNATK